jgi:hypothetical protein
MKYKEKVMLMMICICGVYLIAACTGILFVLFLIKGKWIAAITVLILELCLFYLGRELRRKLWL